jgi:hypothetical protein
VARDGDDFPAGGDGAHGVRKRGFALARAAGEDESAATVEQPAANFLHCLCNKHEASLAAIHAVREALMTLFSTDAISPDDRAGDFTDARSRVVSKH